MAHVGFRYLMYILECIRDLRASRRALGLKISFKLYFRVLDLYKVWK